MKKNKILIICGPTATGKTTLGIDLAKKYNGAIISADSRQVYRGMDVGTGKGLDSSMQYVVDRMQTNQTPYYLKDGICIYGYDLVRPNDDFSVSQYRQRMLPVIEQLWSENKLPIIAGGTGFYIDALLDPPETVAIPPNRQLRSKLEDLPVETLQQRLNHLDPVGLSTMNRSDRLNPRRLIRAIEIAQPNEARVKRKEKRNSNTPGSTSLILDSCDTLWLGLTAPKEFLKQRVVENVEKRATDSFTEEIKSLDQQVFDWHSEVAKATGYQEWKAYLEGNLSFEQAKQNWITREHQYQKRQLTYFKANSSINWFRIDQENWLRSVEATVEAW